MESQARSPLTGILCNSTKSSQTIQKLTQVYIYLISSNKTLTTKWPIPRALTTSWIRKQLTDSTDKIDHALFEVQRRETLYMYVEFLTLWICKQNRVHQRQRCLPAGPGREQAAESGDSAPGGRGGGVTSQAVGCLYIQTFSWPPRTEI